MSETLEAPVVETTEAPSDDRFAGMQFGSDQEQDGSAVEQPEETEQPEPNKPEPKPDSTPEFLRRRIGKSVALQRQAERERDEGRVKIENLERALRHARGEEEPAPREQTPDEIRAEERQRIERDSAQERSASDFNQTCNSLAQKIGSEFGERAAVEATQKLAENVGLSFDNPDHQSVIRDISKLPNAAQVYRALAQDPDAAYRIFEAEDKREGYAELRDFARGLKANAEPAAQAPSAQPTAPAQPRPISQAPRPAGRTPAPARSSSRSVYDDDVSMDDFIAMRNKRG
ncbi:hypothetical protein [Gluconobacter cerinus]|uniref:Scaffolding protein n=1 Tax=Gluconobacter cerinus TaxID=38307 RepID=A0A1B6VP87_9PROT|nr:hypothetical protein [Gluconobacter cerinus]OAJ69036.1 hypothetical protein A0123_00606 [Gluconobacter cerinus]